ncbi:MAG: dihydroorotate dehydrogenase-like protein, partial [Planctomycetota bacterium]
MDLSTNYLGLTLKNPIVPSACAPLSATVNRVQELEDAGASAVVIYSLFEEQITHEENALDHYLNYGTDSYAEALTYFPEPKSFLTGPEEYLEHIRKIKKSVDIPIIGSLNGTTDGGWIEYARYIEEAGADALELNIYNLPTNPLKSSLDVEETYLKIVNAVKASVKIPVAVKIGPYFSSLASMIRQLDLAGADALVLFNRFYQPDLDLENLEVVPHLVLSSSFEMRLPLRWIAIMYGKIKANLALTSGVHTFEDVLKV